MERREGRVNALHLRWSLVKLKFCTRKATRESSDETEKGEKKVFVTGRVRKGEKRRPSRIGRAKEKMVWENGASVEDHGPEGRRRWIRINPLLMAKGREKEEVSFQVPTEDDEVEEQVDGRFDMERCSCRDEDRRWSRAGRGPNDIEGGLKEKKGVITTKVKKYAQRDRR